MTEIYTPITTAKESKQPMITSLEVAEMVGKQHRNVLQDIRKIGNELDLLNVQQVGYFTESCYKAGNGQQQPMFLLTKQGCELYGNRMTGIDGTAFAIKYIERFNDMEEALQQHKLPTTYKEALLALVEAEEIKEQLHLEVKEKEELLIEQTPKVEYVDDVLNSEGLLSTTQISKDYNGMSATAFNKMLHDYGIQYQRGSQWFLYAKYADKGYVKSVTTKGYTYTKWTQVGRNFLYEFLKEKGVLPTLVELGGKPKPNLD